MAGRGLQLVSQENADQRHTALPFPGPARGIVLWPLSNQVTSVLALLQALAQGLLPLLLPGSPSPARLSALHERYPRFGLYRGAGIDWPAEPAEAAGQLYLGLLTSGSTGEPKAIVTSAARLAAGIRAIHAAQQLEPVASTAALLPLAYSFACVNQLLWAVLYRRQLVLPGSFADLAPCLATLREQQIGMLCLVNHQVRALATRLAQLAPLPSVSVVNFAGAPFPAAQFDQLRQLFPRARFYNNYGCAEAMPRLCCRQVLGANEASGWVGHPIGDIALRVDEPGGGPILFRGSSTALGVLDTDGQLRPFPEWIASGDQGRIGPDGLEVLGRHDQVVKIGGERLSLLEVEQALLAAGALNALVWLEATEPTEQVRVVVRFGQQPDLAGLLSLLRTRLPRPLLPQTIYLTQQWRYTDNQKTDAVALRLLAQTGELEQLWPVPP
ncbi:AMP-binding protein [Chitinimonas sp.]|uniref:AMP-binding protein n=1 Tax=Chitinimonas sp. TaxID=1934313 RepID=UPI002F941742